MIPPRGSSATLVLLVPTCLLLVATGAGCVDVSVGGCVSDADCAPGESCVDRACVVLPVCGNELIESGEECDDGEDNGPEGNCSDACIKLYCGDGLVQTGEECDEGDALNGTAHHCGATCKVPCGDGVKEGWEECDLGKVRNLDPYGGCSADCTTALCGNGRPDSGEACDAGLANGQQGSDCSIVCTLPACGNGRRDPGESCDDGNLADGDGCSAVCNFEDQRRVRAIWAGVNQNFALCENGALMGWGINNFGALGLLPGEPGSTSAVVKTPARSGYPDPVGFGAGLRFVVALDSTGHVRVAGDSENGALGDGTVRLHETPEPPAPFPEPHLPPELPDNIQAISVGWVFAVALAGDGSLWGWGSGGGGVLGPTTIPPEAPEPPFLSCRDDYPCTPSPIPLTFAGAGWRQVAAGGAHVVALRHDFGVRVWGAAAAGQVGDPQVEPMTCEQVNGSVWPRDLGGIAEPRTIPAIGLARATFAGLRQTFVLDERGDLWGMGSNCNRELGLPTLDVVDSAFRIELPGSDAATSWEQFQVVRVTSGVGGHTLLLTASGELFGAGASAAGQLGSRPEWNGELPSNATWGRVPSPGGRRIIDAIAANLHTLLLTDEGRVFAFGSSQAGNLGDGRAVVDDANPEAHEVELCSP